MIVQSVLQYRLYNHVLYSQHHSASHHHVYTGMLLMCDSFATSAVVSLLVFVNSIGTFVAWICLSNVHYDISLYNIVFSGVHMNLHTGSNFFSWLESLY